MLDAFELWCWRRHLRVPWTARRSNQSILKEISPECSLVGLMLKLKLQYFGHLMQRANSLEKILKFEGRMIRGWQQMRCHHWHNWHEFEQTLGVGEGLGSLACCSPWGCQEYVCISHFFSYHVIPWESKNPNFLSILVSLGNLLQTRFLALYAELKEQVPVVRKCSSHQDVCYCFHLSFLCVSRLSHVIPVLVMQISLVLYFF